MNYVQSAQGVIGKADQIADRLADRGGAANSDVEPPKKPSRKKSFGPANIAPWTKSAVRAVAFAESRSTRIVGICGINQNVGADSIAAAIAHTYANYGKRILYVEASATKIDDELSGPPGNLLDLVANATAVNHNLDHIDLSDVDFGLPQSTAFFRDTFAKALNTYDALIINLPYANTDDDQPQPTSFTISAACSAALLVCVTGRTTQSAIRQYIASSKISGTNIEGILLNDNQLPLSSVLTKF